MSAGRVESLIYPGERLDTLQRGGLSVLQRADGFRFGMDAVLLAAFASERPVRGEAADLGCGSGVVALLCHARMPKLTFDAVEIQPDVADMARRSMQINGLQAEIRVHTMDVRDAPGKLGHERYRLVTANPPYGAKGGGPVNPNAARCVARHDTEADIAAFCAAAGALLQNGGRFSVVFPAPRLLELFDAMRAGRVEPKRVRMVHPRWGSAPNLALVEGTKAARPMLHFLPPLYVRDEGGHETPELKQIYDD